MNARTQMFASGRRAVPHEDPKYPGHVYYTSRRLIPLLLQGTPRPYAEGRYILGGGWGGGGCTKTGIPR